MFKIIGLATLSLLFSCSSQMTHTLKERGIPILSWEERLGRIFFERSGDSERCGNYFVSAKTTNAIWISFFLQDGLTTTKISAIQSNIETVLVKSGPPRLLRGKEIFTIELTEEEYRRSPCLPRRGISEKTGSRSRFFI